MRPDCVVMPAPPLDQHLRLVIGRQGRPQCLVVAREAGHRPVEVLEGFAFTMLVGIISGTYSTVFIAAAIAIGVGMKVCTWSRRKPFFFSHSASCSMSSSVVPGWAAMK